MMTFNRKPGRFAGLAVALVIVGSAHFCLAQVNITFESPTYNVGNLIGQDGWATSDYILNDAFFGGAVNGTVNVSASGPLAGSRSLLYQQTSVPAGAGATGGSDASRIDSITVNAGLDGADVTVSHLLSATGNGQSATGSVGLSLSHNGPSGASPIFVLLNGTDLIVSNGVNTLTTVPNFTYFDGDVLDLTYNIDFDTSTYELSVENVTTGQFEFADTFGFLATYFPEPGGEFDVDVTAVLRAGTARIDDISIAPGTGPFVNELTWANDASGNWNQSSNWAPGGVPGTSPGRQTAIFGVAINSTQTVFNNSSRSVNRVEFDSANSYIIAGTGSVDMQADTSGGTPVNPTIEVTSGNHQFQIAVNLLDDTTVTVAGGASLTFNNQIDLGGNTLTTNGAVNINHSTIGGGTVFGSGSLGTDGSADIGGDLVSTGALMVDVGAGGADVFHVAGNATLSGILDVNLAPGYAPSSPLTVVAVGGTLDASELLLDASDIESFALTAVGNNLVLSYIGAAVPEPTALGLTLMGLAAIVFRRRISRASSNALCAAAVLSVLAMSQTASAQVIDFETPTYTTGNLIGQDGWVQNSYVTPANLNGTVEVSAALPLVGGQSLLYTKTSAPAGFNAADVSKPFVAFGTRDNTTAVDLTASVRIQADANAFPADRIGVFLSDDAFNGFSPVAVILNGTNIETLHTSGFVTAASYTPNNVIEFQIGVNFDNADYEVSYRDVTAGGALTPLVGPLPGGRYGFFDNPNRFPADGDGVTHTVDVGAFLRGGIGRIDDIVVTGDDFIEARWGGTSGDWSQNLSWIPQLVPNAPTGNAQIAVFDDLAAVPQTVFTNTTQTVNGLRIDNANTFAIAGGGSVNLRSNTIGGTVTPTIDVLQGAHELQVAVNLQNNTSLTVSPGASLDFNNTVSLSGNTLTTSGAVNLNVGVTGGGTISNSGTLGTAGTTPFAANLNSTGTLQIDLGAANTDFFNITGNATLAGLLDVVLEPGFSPSGMYTVLTTSGSLNAAGLTLDPSDTGTFSLGLSGNSLVLTVGGAGLTGDYNNDNRVDAADYVVWRKHNINGQQGYNDWRANFGTSLSGSGAGGVNAVVPEPSSIALGMLAIAACGLIRRANSGVTSRC